MMMTQVSCASCKRFAPSACLLLAALIFLAGCAGTPKPPETPPAPVEPAAASDSSAEPLAAPELIEIRSPVLLPPRMLLVLPVPEPRQAQSLALARPEPPEFPPAPVAIPVPDTPKAPVSPSAAQEESAPKAAEAPAAPPKPVATGAKTSAKPAAKTADKAASKPPEKEASPAKPAVSLPPAPASTVIAPVSGDAVPERTLESPKGSPLELVFPGSGWVYLGETSGREGIRYDSRRFDGASAVFLFAADREGDYVLRFQRQDPVTGEPESRLVGLKIKEPASFAERKPAEKPAASPSAEAAPAAASRAGTVDTGPASPATAGEPGTAEASGFPRELPSSPDELLRLARAELAANRVSSALEALDRYVSLFPFGSDEAFYLYAKAYEQNTPYRDIKKAYGYYRQVRDEWPRSPFWKDAAERATYIERHYFDIR